MTTITADKAIFDKSPLTPTFTATDYAKFFVSIQS